MMHAIGWQDLLLPTKEIKKITNFCTIMKVEKKTF